MANHNDRFDLTTREMQIMEILWSSPTPLIASQIAKKGEELGLTVSTIQPLLKRLMNKELIELDSVVYNVTVLCRSFKPCLSKIEYENQKVLNSIDTLSSVDILLTTKIVTAFIDRSENTQKVLSEIESLEDLLKAKKQELMAKEKKQKK